MGSNIVPCGFINYKIWYRVKIYMKIVRMGWLNLLYHTSNMSKNGILLGSHGSGSITKLCNNLALAIQMVKEMRDWMVDEMKWWNDVWW